MPTLTKQQIKSLAKRTGQILPKDFTEVPAKITDGENDNELTFLHWWKQFAPDLPIPLYGENQYHFHPTRGWRFDFYWPEFKIAVEIEGRGHEQSGRYGGDVTKYNAAAAAGICLMRCTSQMLSDDPIGFIQQVREAMKGRT